MSSKSGNDRCDTQWTSMILRDGREFVRFLGYAYRSLKEVVTCLELCERLYSTGERQALAVLIDEGNQISRMTHTLIRRLGRADHGVRSVSGS